MNEDFYDEESIKELWLDNKDKFGHSFTQREFLQFCYEWDETREKIRRALALRKKRAGRV